MWDMKISLFIHVLCVATWFGATTLMAMYIRNATRSNDQLTITNSLATAHRWNLTMMIPTSVLVLITGMYMLMSYDNKPLWLLVKERLGSVFVVAFILIITLYGKKLLKSVKESASITTSTSIAKKYIMVLNLSVLVMLILIFFVTTKIA
jgi:hypothetical protein